MHDRDLILAILAARTGLVMPEQIVAAVSARLSTRDRRTLLDHLVASGALAQSDRSALESLAAEALTHAEVDPDRLVASLGGVAAVRRSLGVDARLPRLDGEPPVPPERAGQYTRLDELGRGAQSIVFRARDELFGREVALKELHPLEAPSPHVTTPVATEARARFLREARLTARLDHPGIAPVHEVARRPDGTLFCAQKLIQGETLKARLARCEGLRGRLELLPHLINASHAVAYAHSRGVIHRDLKPSNIMVGAFGETVVVDWGLAKSRSEKDEAPTTASAGPSAEPALTVIGLTLGTPLYMSPEQARGAVEEIDERSDVFSLGAILYELLTGRVPFAGIDTLQVIEKVVAGKFYPVRVVCPEAPPELAAIAERALARSPEQRYASADALAKDLLAYRAGHRVQAYEYGSWELVRRFVARNRALSVVGAAALAVLVGSAVVIGYQLRVARLNLASAFLERARSAERASNWGRAAGYYAASRVEHDSREGQWGSALARERISRRDLVKRGPTRSYLDADFLPDGRIRTLGDEGSAIVARVLDTGEQLWRFETSSAALEVVLGKQHVLLVGPQGVRYLDANTGREMDHFPFGPVPERPCPFGPPTRRALVTGEQVWKLERPIPGAESLRVGARPVCVVSDDGHRLAFLDFEGVVHLWDLLLGKEVATRPAPDTGHLLFTAHGLALVRSQSVQLFGSSEGDFTVDIPGRSATPRDPQGWRGDAVSPDGHLLVIANPTSNQAELVDLRTRAVFDSLTFPEGQPKFSFSPDGGRLLVSSLLDGSTVVGWQIRPPGSQGGESRGSRLIAFRSSADGKRFLLFHYEPGKSRLELRDVSGVVIRTWDVPDARNVALSGDGAQVAAIQPNMVQVWRADTGELVAELPCENCWRGEPSQDGGRLLTRSPGSLDLWNVAARRKVWSESERLGAVAGPHLLSEDGRHVVWARGARLFIHSEDGSPDRALDLDDRIAHTEISNDNRLLGVVTTRTVSAWALDGLRRLWSTPKQSWFEGSLAWARDDSAVILAYEALGVVLLDARTGVPFASIAPSTPGAFGAQENVLPDLRHRLSRGNGIWKLTELPSPDTDPPRQSLTRVLREASLELQGVELVDAVASGPTGSARP